MCHSLETLAEAVLQHLLPGDALVANIGLHCLNELSYPEWKKLMDRVAALLREVASRKVDVYWRTSASVVHHAFWPHYKPSLKFLTEARRQLFDLYAEAAMHRAGIRVFDIHGLPVDYTDLVHYDLAGFDVHNRVLSQVLC
jgi:hypothetical protein